MDLKINVENLCFSCKNDLIVIAIYNMFYKKNRYFFKSKILQGQIYMKKLLIPLLLLATNTVNANIECPTPATIKANTNFTINTESWPQLFKQTLSIYK